MNLSDSVRDSHIPCILQEMYFFLILKKILFLNVYIHLESELTLIHLSAHSAKIRLSVI